VQASLGSSALNLYLGYRLVNLFDSPSLPLQTAAAGRQQTRRPNRAIRAIQQAIDSFLFVEVSAKLTFLKGGRTPFKSVSSEGGQGQRTHSGPVMFLSSAAARGKETRSSNQGSVLELFTGEIRKVSRVKSPFEISARSKEPAQFSVQGLRIRVNFSRPGECLAQ
jgi:hypothetical protein